MFALPFCIDQFIAEGELPVMIVDDWSEVPDQIAISEIRNEASILDLADKYLVPLSDLAG